MSKEYDKNGKKLGGTALVAREISRAGGVREYKKSIAMNAVDKLFEEYPEAIDVVCNTEDRKERKKKFKVLK